MRLATRRVVAIDKCLGLSVLSDATEVVWQACLAVAAGAAANSSSYDRLESATSSGGGNNCARSVGLAINCWLRFTGYHVYILSPSVGQKS